MARIRTLVPLIVGLALMLVGCADKGVKFAGSYSVRQELSKAGQTLEQKTASAALQKQMADVKIGLALNTDKTAALSMSGMQGTPPMTIPGTWEYKDDLVRVTFNPAGGGGAALPMELVPTDDGKTLTTGGSQFGSLKFTKN
jgi:hypothetical protein